MYYEPFKWYVPSGLSEIQLDNTCNWYLFSLFCSFCR